MNGEITKSIAKLECDDSNLMLLIRWKNGDLSRLPYVWLRDNCPEPHTMSLTDRTKARSMTMKDLDVNVKPEEVSLMKDGTVAITWPHVGLSKYSTHWILDHDISDPKIQQNRPHRHFAYKVLWNKDIFWKSHKYIKKNKLFRVLGKFFQDPLNRSEAKGAEPRKTEMMSFKRTRVRF